ncbi:MAG: sulD [Ilumatobacteraceae bacterium]|nr:sulD [Ilumatobacteraceae bacterium]
MDRVEINGLRVVTVVGVLPHERQMAQPLELDIVIEADLRDAGISDDLDDTANYGAVAERAATIARESRDLLLERLAQRIAEDVLSIDRVAAVEVVLRKVRPPIPEDMANTAVRIRRTRSDLDVPVRAAARAIVALGSNLGDRLAFLRGAVDAFGPNVQALSRVYETAPIGGPEGQGAYLNMVVVVETSLDPFAMLRWCQRIEARALRQRGVRWGARTLDVDLLFYDDTSIASPELTVPHPRIAQRRFVLAPLSDVAPERCPPNWETTLPTDDVTVLGDLADLL